MASNMDNHDRLYNQLATTATNFILATSPTTPGTNHHDGTAFLSLCSPNFTHTWGHSHFVTTNPGVQGEIDGQGFLDRMNKLSSRMETWTIKPTETLVDVKKRQVVIRADFAIVIPGYEPVVNDIVWFVTVDESGEMVVGSREFIDPVAAGVLREQMMGGGHKGA
ncbi:hypothetical protein LTR62_005134 [Meristemomyces frigidus]|uniref:SnoaL-like domain-containing protein n=1 Tax=Meristemomyces frigidus TaxID=1508187 RepID=A0AAN7TI89_9PEZI|nr:hypothetical protein LTR62_005134 [Meristemomyces frigidus]